MRHWANKMKKLYLINDICVCCGAPVDEGTMVCQRCLDSTEKEHELWQEETTKRICQELILRYEQTTNEWIITKSED